MLPFPDATTSRARCSNTPYSLSLRKSRGRPCGTRAYHLVTERIKVPWWCLARSYTWIGECIYTKRIPGEFTVPIEEVGNRPIDKDRDQFQNVRWRTDATFWLLMSIVRAISPIRRDRPCEVTLSISKLYRYVGVRSPRKYGRMTPCQCSLRKAIHKKNYLNIQRIAFQYMNSLRKRMPFLADVAGKVPDFFEHLFYAVALHDFGKAADRFPKSTHWRHSDGVIRHEILSAGFVAGIQCLHKKRNKQSDLQFLTHHKDIDTLRHGSIHALSWKWNPDSKRLARIKLKSLEPNWGSVNGNSRNYSYALVSSGRMFCGHLFTSTDQLVNGYRDYLAALPKG